MAITVGGTTVMVSVVPTPGMTWASAFIVLPHLVLGHCFPLSHQSEGTGSQLLEEWRPSYWKSGVPVTGRVAHTSLCVCRVREYSLPSGGSPWIGES